MSRNISKDFYYFLLLLVLLFLMIHQKSVALFIPNTELTQGWLT